MFKAPSPTGITVALAPILFVVLAVGSLIGLDKAGVKPFVEVVDHQYTAENAAELNKNNCTTYSPRTDGAIIGVNCQQASVPWRPKSADYRLF